MVRCAPTSPSRAWVSSVDLPGRGTTAVWQCAGPPQAETLVLLHGVAMTAELCWFRVLEQLGRQFRIVAPDLARPWRRDAAWWLPVLAGGQC